MAKLKNWNATFLVIFLHCVAISHKNSERYPGLFYSFRILRSYGVSVRKLQNCTLASPGEIWIWNSGKIRILAVSIFWFETDSNWWGIEFRMKKWLHTWNLIDGDRTNGLLKFFWFSQILVISRHMNQNQKCFRSRWCYRSLDLPTFLLHILQSKGQLACACLLIGIEWFF